MSTAPAMAKRGIDDIQVGGRRVLLRVDFNVPMEEGRIVDDRRIQAAVPTIEALLRRGARIVVVTHFGRPKGRVDEANRVAPHARRLGELLGVKVAVAADSGGAASRALDESLCP